MMRKNDEPVLVCIIDAIPKAQRPMHQANTERIFTLTQEVRELETGYAFRFPNEMDLLHAIVAFLCYERLCCPFFVFNLEIQSDQGPIWLSITGAVDVKEFLRSEGLFVSPS